MRLKDRNEFWVVVAGFWLLGLVLGFSRGLPKPQLDRVTAVTRCVDWVYVADTNALQTICWDLESCQCPQ